VEGEGASPAPGLRRYTVAMVPPEAPLPRPPGDEENLRRLRQQAAERLAREEPPGPEPWVGPRPPAPVYGSPFRMATRRWSLRRILVLIGSLVAAIAAIWKLRKVPQIRISAPVYGGPPAPTPPPPQPQPQADPRQSAPAYGGPPPQPPPQPTPRQAAPVYGGPPPKPPDGGHD